MFHMPISSPMMNTMLGFFCWAAAGPGTQAKATRITNNPMIILVFFPFILFLPPSIFVNLFFTP